MSLQPDHQADGQEHPEQPVPDQAQADGQNQAEQPVPDTAHQNDLQVEPANNPTVEAQTEFRQDNTQPIQEVHSTVTSPSTSNTNVNDQSNISTVVDQHVNTDENLTRFEKENNFVLRPDEYVDVLMICKVHQKLYDPISDTGIRHVYTQTKIQKNNQDRTIPGTTLPGTNRPLVQFKHEPSPMQRDEV